MRATIREVAQRAGVSIGTVSRVVHGDPRVLPENRARVQAAIAALGYRPDLVARSLVGRGARQRAAGALPPHAPRLITVGYVSMDQTVLLPSWPERGSRMAADRIVRGIGGPAANVAIAAARLGGPYRLGVDLISALGDDADSDWAIEQLLEVGVCVDGMARVAGARLSRSVILVEPSGFRTVLNEPLNVPVPTLREHLLFRLGEPRPVCLHLEGYRVDLIGADGRVEGCTPGRITLDSTGLPPIWQQWTAFERLLDRVDVLFLSRRAARRILDLDVEDHLLAPMLWDRMGGRQQRAAVAVTLGAGGSTLIAEGTIRHHPAPAVSAVDVTGAGDVFAGVFLGVWLVTGDPWLAMVEAVTGAALSVTAPGVNSLPITAEAIARARQGA